MSSVPSVNSILFVRVEQERSLALEDVMDTLTNSLPRRGFSVEPLQPNQLIIRSPHGGAATVTVERFPDRVLTGEMLPEYYQLRGWTPDGKVPQEKKQALGLTQ